MKMTAVFALVFWCGSSARLAASEIDSAGVVASGEMTFHGIRVEDAPATLGLVSALEFEADAFAGAGASIDIDFDSTLLDGELSIDAVGLAEAGVELTAAIGDAFISLAAGAEVLADASIAVTLDQLATVPQTTSVCDPVPEPSSFLIFVTAAAALIYCRAKSAR